jgi:hypothetical protein
MAQHTTERKNIKYLLTREGLVRDIGPQRGEGLPVSTDKRVYFAPKICSTTSIAGVTHEFC